MVAVATLLGPPRGVHAADAAEFRSTNWATKRRRSCLARGDCRLRSPPSSEDSRSSSSSRSYLRDHRRDHPCHRRGDRRLHHHAVTASRSHGDAHHPPPRGSARCASGHLPRLLHGRGKAAARALPGVPRTARKGSTEYASSWSVGRFTARLQGPGSGSCL